MMAYFAYKGRNTEGQLIQGVLEAEDPGAVAAQLFELGVTPVEIGVTAKPRERTDDGGFLQRLARRTVESEDLLLFSRQMHTLLKAGVPIMRALTGLQESATGPMFRRNLQSVRENLESGRPLSTALQRQSGVFSPFYVAMIFVGESTGMLEEIFLRLFHHLEFQEFMRRQVRAALRYPTIVIVAMAIAIVVINLFVIPAFAKVYAGFDTELPALTRGLIAFSELMQATWWLQGLILIALFFGFRAWTDTAGGGYAWDRFKLRVPVAGKIVLKAALARFARSFALAIRSGVPIVQGLTLVAQTVDNAYLARQIERMREGVERGESVLRTAASAGVFTPVVLQMVMVGEESGSLDDMMSEIADMYQREVEYELKTLGAQIEPILIVALGVLVLILALGVFLPIWDLGTAALGR
jgi:MSHA biogenesis protein MshG